MTGLPLTYASCHHDRVAALRTGDVRPDGIDLKKSKIDEVFGGDAWPYGIEPNRPTLEALVQYMAEQNLIARAMPIEQLFVPLPCVGGH